VVEVDMRTTNRLGRRLAGVVLGTALATAVAAQPPADKVPKDKAPSKTATEPPPATILGPNELPIDLTTALRLAGVDNPEIQLARERISEQAALRMLAVAQLLPNLNLGTNYDGHSGVLQQSNGNILKVNRNALYFGLGAQAIAAGTVNIPGLNYNMNVGEAWFGYLMARQRVRTAAAAADATRNETLLRVCSAYLDLLRSDGHRAIAQKNRAEAAELSRIVTAWAETKLGRKADADRALVELRKRDADLIQAEADTLTSSARLAQLLNLDPSVRFKPIDGWVVPTPLVPDPIPLQELIAIALLQRPELAARRSEVQTALYDLSLSKALPFSPNVILGYSAGGFGGGSNLISTPPGFVAGNGQLQTGPRFGDFQGRSDFDAVFFWTVRNLGVGNVALIRAADSRVKQSRFRELETLNAVRAQVAEAHARVAARYLQIDATEKAVRSSTAAFGEDLTRIRGFAGAPLEAVDSMRLLARSRYELLDTIVDYNRAQFQLWVALGRPPASALARPVPPELVPPPVIEVQTGPRPFPMPRVLPMPLPVKP
jgi:outer membrane protein TolC